VQTKEVLTAAFASWHAKGRTEPATVRIINYLLVFHTRLMSGDNRVYAVVVEGYRNKLDDDCSAIAFRGSMDHNRLVDDYRLSESDFMLKVKWDGCSDLLVENGGWLHFCCGEQVAELASAISQAHVAAELMINSWPQAA
jgi:hypothetical protein